MGQRTRTGGENAPPDDTCRRGSAGSRLTVSPSTVACSSHVPSSTLVTAFAFSPNFPIATQTLHRLAMKLHGPKLVVPLIAAQHPLLKCEFLPLTLTHASLLSIPSGR